MIYRDFKGEKISALGFGCMRFPLINGEDKSIDKEKAAELIDKAYKNGVNYFDTAWGYHGGNSELVTGEILSRYDRKTFNLATKFPGYDVENFSRTEEIFNRQLEKCRVEYFDFYLLHCVTDGNIENYLTQGENTVNYLSQQKEKGRIRHLGFSAHAEIPTMRRFLEKYSGYMEFCQLQINYLDWTYQNAKEKVELCKEFGIPVWIMEPVRGGKLAKPGEKNEKLLHSARPDESTAAWAFRFCQGIPEVKVILSGMSDMIQVEDNLKTFAEEKPLSADEYAVLDTVAEDLLTAIPCTACRYCTDRCPKGINIPLMLELYNKLKANNSSESKKRLSEIPADKMPSACIVCRNCEKVCPQQIKISEALAEFRSIL